ncbi:bifunctional serine/threonine-protein kinase/formylglycine-generating enzyme family protein [Acaryochloris sp. IP29b_bin.148]|uniref:bifunctional serine/threonine-protein kinase/formylglycine-generating enzyme family protein n=1 Tax=Acaryochloris sp. IP29b_bin.148 TaxID=2969218 RepID=UPI002607CF99|nr:bifunctional serine/threonine-protein kinase/formylglycine-generating enzyme family protein [Acaryochloris sp. IP29b_bin.148]
MICCLNPDCEKPLNQDDHKYCESCGTRLIPLLRNRFKVIKPLGQGGFGKTYLAEDIDKLNGLCVIKQLFYQGQSINANQKILELFMREAKQLDRLKANEQIPDLLAYFEEGGYLYLAQEYIEGEDLLNELHREGPFNEEKIQEFFLDLLPVLKFIHDKGLIHRDLKPENIMRRKKDGRLILIDFGVARQISMSQLTVIGTIVGSHGYSSIEQLTEGKVTASSDLYSIGATAFHLLTGQFPGDLFHMQGYEWVSHWHDYLSNTIDPDLIAVISKLLQIKAVDRYQAASSVLADLNPQTKVRQQASTVPVQSQPQAPSIKTQSPTPQPISQVTPRPFSLATHKFDFEIVSVDEYGRIINRSKKQAQFFKEDLGNGVTLDMVAIPGGTFIMGSHNCESERLETEGPQHEVTVPAFYVGKYPITQAQWKAVMGPNPSHFKGANRPVESVSWGDAIDFCEKLSKKSGKHYRLPSEAEWEYICRAGTITTYYYGETISTDLANYRGTDRGFFTVEPGNYGSGPKGEYREQTTEVGSFSPNAFGLYDMHGNVWEWCQDTWHENYEGAPTDGSAWINENDGDSRRVQRGGSWDDVPRYCRSATRNRLNPSFRFNSDFGFRVALVASSTLL